MKDITRNEPSNLPAIPDVEPVRRLHYGDMVKVHVFSFGYLWHDNPAALATNNNCTVLVDVRKLLFNPFHDTEMRELTGLDPRIQDYVLRTPGALELADSIASIALNALATVDALGRQVKVGIGCSGGRHRSVVLADMVGQVLNQAGAGTEVTHYDVLRPVWRQQAGEVR